MADERVHLVVTGRVQGVGYRMHAQSRAQALGLKGWVRNLPEGHVEAVAEGPKDKLEELVSWCWIGPPAARVKDVRGDWSEATGEFTAFVITR